MEHLENLTDYHELSGEESWDELHMIGTDEQYVTNLIRACACEERPLLLLPRKAEQQPVVVMSVDYYCRRLMAGTPVFELCGPETEDLLWYCEEYDMRPVLAGGPGIGHLAAMSVPLYRTVCDYLARQTQA